MQKLPIMGVILVWVLVHSYATGPAKAIEAQELAPAPASEKFKVTNKGGSWYERLQRKWKCYRRLNASGIFDQGSVPKSIYHLEISNSEDKIIKNKLKYQLYLKPNAVDLRKSPCYNLT